MSSLLPRLLLALAYPWLAHWASHGGGDGIALLALLDLVLVVLIDGLLRLRLPAWLALAGSAAVLAVLHGSVWPRVLLLAPPMLFTGLVAWWFARSLADPRGALISRIVAALEDASGDSPAEDRKPAALAPDLLRYTRGLTLAWALVLASLCLANGVLALVAVPDGALALLGLPPPFTVTRAQWSLFANLLNYGFVGLFFIAEYRLRLHLFPRRPYRSFVGFLGMMGRLGPEFWRGLFARR